MRIKQNKTKNIIPRKLNDSKKGMEMTLSTVIVAILLLVVLAVVVFMFIKGMRVGDSTMTGYFTKVNNSDKDPAKAAEGFFKTGFILPLALPIFKRRQKYYNEV